MTTAVISSAGVMQQRPFVLFWFTRVSATMGVQMLTLLIAWKLYELTNSALDLGLLGLIQFVPAVVLTLLIGHTADRYDRRLIIRAAQGVYVVAAVLTTVALLTDRLDGNLLFASTFLIGCARAFELPTGSALVPVLVPPPLTSRAVAAWSSANQVAVICGPALGGLIYALNPVVVGTVCIVLFSLGIGCVSLIQVQRPPPPREPPTISSVLAGIHFIRTRPRLLGVVTLDLFVVVLGGATALLPIYARDILIVGPIGLGLLRSAPAVGALVTAVVLSRRPVERHIGPKMFAVVAIYGVATIVFALSTSFPLSLIALAALGASDAVSVVIRFSLVQIETPDAMRGRVSAINYLFVGSSNTLGEFESGALAAWLGAVPSVLIGGIGSLVIAAAWMLMFPGLRRLDRFEPADEAETKAPCTF
ncbi:MAG TPA: MFS transporter [Pseudolabrys sp.]|nr:MFS transporter [Pseudolabrys sp.]